MNQMGRVLKTLALLTIVLVLGAPLKAAAEQQPQMTGDTRIHDPSVIEINGRFVAVGTGQQGPTHGAIRVKVSTDGLKWTEAGLIGEGPPPWSSSSAGFQAAQRLGALDQPSWEHDLPLLLLVELRAQCERHRAHDQQFLRSAHAWRGLEG